jgi:hypothetical protein
VPWLIAAAVVLVLCCGGGIAAIAIVSSDDDTASDSSGDRPEPPGEAAGIGEPVRDGQFEFVVTELQTGVESVGEGEFGEAAQGEFALVNLTVENIGDDEQLFDGDAQLLFDTEGREHSHADVEAALYLEGSESFLNEINPGNTVEGTLLYDLPPDAVPERVELHDSPFSNGVDVNLQ